MYHIFIYSSVDGHLSCFQFLVGLMVDSGRAHAKEYFPELLLPVSLSSWWGAATPRLCRRPSNTSSDLGISHLIQGRQESLASRAWTFPALEICRKKQEELQSCSLWNKNHIYRKIDKMKRQRAMYQLKEQDNPPEKQLNEVEIGNLPEMKFKIL